MTIDEAISAVRSRARARTYSSGDARCVDEILVDEIERLRAEIKTLKAAAATNATAV